MARGFDSKSVSDQQEDLQRRRERGERSQPVSARRRQLELARTDLQHRLETATGRYRETLERGLKAVEEQLRGEKI